MPFTSAVSWVDGFAGASAGAIAAAFLDLVVEETVPDCSETVFLAVFAIFQMD
ncbi:hypothetical protein C943_03290 [Mariniradius saccharolyticus AK6]|uniref:Uncharacterized protein n=1 Tax=Mariniradius saccharolyticus AK6 TaxID=1239962 RepID=M7XJ67_9BACT|nr:hypothetical protein C943_03290 [Mariniradius saccharolyticus AK6]